MKDDDEMEWAITSDSKIVLGLTYGKHGYQPNWKLAAFLDALSREVRYRGKVYFKYTKQHDLDPWDHLADNIARSNLVVRHRVPHMQVAESVEYGL
eukprot:2794271-Pyramimonas_sp.AAC.1